MKNLFYNKIILICDALLYVFHYRNVFSRKKFALCEKSQPVENWVNPGNLRLVFMNTGYFLEKSILLDFQFQFFAAFENRCTLSIRHEYITMHMRLWNHKDIRKTELHIIKNQQLRWCRSSIWLRIKFLLQSQA